GVITRSVEDACIALQAVAGRDSRDMTSADVEIPDYLASLNSDMHGKKLAVLGNVMDGLLNDNVRKVFNGIVEKLKERGAQVDVVYFDQKIMRAVLPAYYAIANAEASSNNADLDGMRFGVREPGETTEDIMMNTRTKNFNKMIRRRFTIGAFALDGENQEKIFRKAKKVRRLICEEINGCLEEYDAILAPTDGDIAPRFDDPGADPLSDYNLVTGGHLDLENFNGSPSMSVPMGFDQGCPLGISITAKPFDEITMFNVAKAVEEITGLKGLTAEVK
ncbi:MAG: Asp-tRNA(Asn)/Glu-tRNA(Gln) amidotransferase subunit GatA, partial [Solobacterium sp.]|nr:Asp-tRNA(Asn)/Glu-tRNA(Gln) amidotransferase subunit GatA [Solobacterium sp.]